MTQEHTGLPLILGSTSPFRASLLSKLKVPFETAAPNIDETRLANESPADLVTRLTKQKAEAVGQNFPHQWVIASDQIAVFDDQTIGKPHHHAAAVEQLSIFSGNTVTFLTGLGLLHAASGEYHFALEPFKVHFRELSLEQIDAYLRLEEPYQCAGSFKSEGLGITLFSQLEGDDPNTLVGLPLIRLTAFLDTVGIHLPQVFEDNK